MSSMGLQNLLTLHWVAIVIWATCLSACEAAVPSPATPAGRLAQAAEKAGIHNFLQASASVYSGAQPEGDTSFAYLASLGIKTIVSVDGSKPDLEAAKKHGLRYIHLPFGYDGIPTNRVAELAKFAMSEKEPIFIHCHHGNHRGPAAVAVVCRSKEGWTSLQATQFMARAGTAVDYPGLYQAAAQFQQPSESVLRSLGELPEVSSTPPLVEVMVSLDDRFDRLKKLLKKTGSSDAKLKVESTLLWEQIHELMRSDATQRNDADYRRLMQESEGEADKLRRLLNGSISGTSGAELIQGAVKKVSDSCVACHRKYRNPPKSSANR